MNSEKVLSLKKEIIDIGRLLWDKDLASGLNGNISARVDAATILITAHNSCLGRLNDQELVVMDLGGGVIEGREVSYEKLLHTEIYKNFPETQAVIHTHSPYTNGYFVANQSIEPATFENKLYLGRVESILQTTPTVTDVAPITQALGKNNIVVLSRHGSLAVGKNLFECFLLIQCLEEAVKVDVVKRLYEAPYPEEKNPSKGPGKESGQKRYQLFSDEQIAEIVRLVNADAKVKELGEKTNMTMSLAVKCDESGRLFSFQFDKGRIVKVGSDEASEFLITAPELIWRAVFNREIDPFVATTQKKMILRGDFAKISKWFAPCSRIFEIWQQVPVE